MATCTHFLNLPSKLTWHLLAMWERSPPNSACTFGCSNNNNRHTTTTGHLTLAAVHFRGTVRWTRDNEVKKSKRARGIMLCTSAAASVEQPHFLHCPALHCVTLCCGTTLFNNLDYSSHTAVNCSLHTAQYCCAILHCTMLCCTTLKHYKLQYTTLCYITLRTGRVLARNNVLPTFHRRRYDVLPFTLGI